MVASPARGFTLLEILVVLVILAVLTSAVLLTGAGQGLPEQAEHEARRLQQLMRLQCEQALLSASPIGLEIGPSNYRFLLWRDQQWEAASGTVLRLHTLPSRLRLRLMRAGTPVTLEEQLSLQPQVVCFASGEATPFRLAIDSQEPNGSAELVGAINGEIDITGWRQRG